MFENKKTVHVGGNVVERRKEPISPRTADRMTQYVYDYKTLQKLTPDNRKKTLVEAGPGPKGSRNGFQSINPATNRSLCFGPTYNVNLGSSPDDPGLF